MTIKELVEKAAELFAAPPPCGWPEPEVVTYADGRRYVAWEPLGDDVDSDELRSIIAMLARALVEVES